MGRTTKQTVDWFKHYCTHKKTLFILEQLWQNDGYAFWFKTLELLGRTDGHYYDCSILDNWEYLCAYTCCAEDKALDILEKLAKLDAIDRELWLKRKIIWSDNFVDGIGEVYARRVVAVPQKPPLCRPKQDKCRRDEDEKPENGGGKAPRRAEKKRGEQNIPSRARRGGAAYADTVFLTGEEYARLAAEFTEVGANRLVEILDAYKTNNPKKCREYRDDNKVIRSWVISRYLDERQKSGQEIKPPPPAPPQAWEEYRRKVFHSQARPVVFSHPAITATAKELDWRLTDEDASRRRFEAEYKAVSGWKG